MSFFILTGAILLGTVFIVHFAANALGFRLFYSSLFLSALFAFSINLIVISMKEVTTPLSMAKIFLTVLFASALVTVINEILVRREKKKLQEKRKRKREEARETAKEKAFEETLNETLSEKDEVADVQKKEGFFKRLFGGIFTFGLNKKKSEINEEQELQAEEIEEETAEEEIPESEVEEKVEAKEVEKPKKDNFITKLFKKEEKSRREKLDISQFQDLDAILDFAYEAKISGKYQDAVEAYEGAIERYENDPYLPFLFIDLANVHKSHGEYEAAIDIYEKAINMPNIEKDSNILKSFKENIDYLKALKTVLRTHKIEHKPFGEIDESILKEAEKRVEN